MLETGNNLFCKMVTLVEKRMEISASAAAVLVLHCWINTVVKIRRPKGPDFSKVSSTECFS